MLSSYHVCIFIFVPCLTTNVLIFVQDPSINITELKEIHSDINLPVPDPILFSNLHDGLEAVRIHFRVRFRTSITVTVGKARMRSCC